MKEELIALGKVLQSDFENLVSQQITGWLINDSLTDSDWRQLGELEAELADFFEINDQFAALEAWLTSGFIPGELPDFGLATEEWTAETRGENLHRFTASSYTHSNSRNATEYKVGEFRSPSVKPTESSAVETSIADREAVKNLGVAKNQDDSDGVGILPTLKNQGTGETPIRQDKSIHPVNLQAQNLNQPKWRSPLGLKDLSAETSITEAEEVKSTTGTEWRSPLGLKDLSAETSITEAEEVKTKTGTEWRSPLGLKDLATVLETETSITEAEEVKTKTGTEWRSPLGLKDLAKFLTSESYSSDSDTITNQQAQAIKPEIQTASTPIFPTQNSDYWEGLEEETKIGWPDLIPNAIPQTDDSSFEGDGGASYPVSSHNAQMLSDFKNNQTTELFSQEQHQDRELQMEIEPNPGRNPEIDMDLIVEAIAQEINREYRRFYGS